MKKDFAIIGIIGIAIALICAGVFSSNPVDYETELRNEILDDVIMCPGDYIRDYVESAGFFGPGITWVTVTDQGYDSENDDTYFDCICQHSDGSEFQTRYSAKYLTDWVMENR